MTPAITFEEQCEDLGVSPEAFDRAWVKIARESEQYGSIDAMPFSAYPEFLEPDELIAIIRLEELDKRLPQYFDRFGFVG